MEDLIRRSDAIDDVYAHDDGTPWGVKDVLYMLNHLPSANGIPIDWIKQYAARFPEDAFPFKKMLDAWEARCEE